MFALDKQLTTPDTPCPALENLSRMKTVPQHAGVLNAEEKSRPGDILPAEGALALVQGTGVPRQRLLDFPFAMNDGPTASPDEVIELLNELKPGYRATLVVRGDRTLHVITARS